MRHAIHGKVAIGHTDARRTIFDLIKEGDSGGGEKVHNLALFMPLHPGAAIGSHYHSNMWETYVILSGEGVMTLIDVESCQAEDIEIDHQMLPYRITIPPNVAHRLTAQTTMTLLIAATGEQTPADTFPYRMD